MKKNAENIFIPLTPDELKKLAMSLPVGITEVQPKFLSTADLWHIQRNKKAIRSRRGLNLV